MVQKFPEGPESKFPFPRRSVCPIPRGRSEAETEVLKHVFLKLLTQGYPSALHNYEVKVSEFLYLVGAGMGFITFAHLLNIRLGKWP